MDFNAVRNQQALLKKINWLKISCPLSKERRKINKPV
jgi:hypothetical protein